MKIPKTLKIGGHDIKVIYPYVFTEVDGKYGQFDHAAKEIRISNLDSGGQERAESGVLVTLLHEIVHVVDYLTGHHGFSGDNGENKIEGLSEGLFQVLRDNDLDFRKTEK